MATVVFDAAAQGFNASASSVTVALTVAGSNRVLVAFPASWNVSVSGATITSVTYDGVALTLVDQQDFFSSGTQARHEMWVLVAPHTGTHDLVVTAAATGYLYLAGLSFTAAHQTTPLGTVAKLGADALASFQLTVPSSSTDGMIVAGSLSDAPGTLQAPATGRTAQDSSYHQTVTSPGSASAVLVDWATTTRFAVLGAAVLPASSAAALDGSAALALTTAATLSTGIPLTGTAALVVSTTASLGAVFDGSAALALTTAATLSTGIPLTGTAALVVGASAVMRGVDPTGIDVVVEGTPPTLPASAGGKVLDSTIGTGTWIMRLSESGVPSGGAPHVSQHSYSTRCAFNVDSTRVLYHYETNHDGRWAIAAIDPATFTYVGIVAFLESFWIDAPLWDLSGTPGTERTLYAMWQGTADAPDASNNRKFYKITDADAYVNFATSATELVNFAPNLRLNGTVASGTSTTQFTHNVGAPTSPITDFAATHADNRNRGRWFNYQKVVWTATTTTVALRGLEYEIANTYDTATRIIQTTTPMAATPVAGDTFYIRPAGYINHFSNNNRFLVVSVTEWTDVSSDSSHTNVAYDLQTSTVYVKYFSKADYSGIQGSGQHRNDCDKATDSPWVWYNPYPLDPDSPYSGEASHRGLWNILTGATIPDIDAPAHSDAGRGYFYDGTSDIIEARTIADIATPVTVFAPPLTAGLAPFGGGTHLSGYFAGYALQSSYQWWSIWAFGWVSDTAPVWRLNQGWLTIYPGRMRHLTPANLGEGRYGGVRMTYMGTAKTDIVAPGQWAYDPAGNGGDGTVWARTFDDGDPNTAAVGSVLDFFDWRWNTQEIYRADLRNPAVLGSFQRICKHYSWVSQTPTGPLGIPVTTTAPRASISQDGRFVCFTSTWGRTGANIAVDVFVAQIEVLFSGAATLALTTSAALSTGAAALSGTAALVLDASAALAGAAALDGGAGLILTASADLSGGSVSPGAGVEERNLLRVGSRKRPDLNSRVKTFAFKYSPDMRKDGTFQYTTSVRTVAAVGKDVILEHSPNPGRFLRDRTAADIVACYLAKTHALVADIVEDAETTEEGRYLNHGDVVTVTVDRLQLAAASRRIIALTEGLGSQRLHHLPYDANAYVYDVGTLPALQVDDDTISAPGAVTGLVNLDQKLTSAMFSWVFPAEDNAIALGYNWDLRTVANGGGAVILSGFVKGTTLTLSAAIVGYGVTRYFRVQPVKPTGDVGAFTSSVSVIFSRAVANDIGSQQIGTAQRVLLSSVSGAYNLASGASATGTFTHNLGVIPQWNPDSGNINVQLDISNVTTTQMSYALLNRHPSSTIAATAIVWFW